MEIIWCFFFFKKCRCAQTLVLKKFLDALLARDVAALAVDALVANDKHGAAAVAARALVGAGVGRAARRLAARLLDAPGGRAGLGGR